MKGLERRTERLSVEVYVNGRARSNVVLWRLSQEDESWRVVDEINLGSEKERQRLLERVPHELQAEAGQLLEDVAVESSRLRSRLGQEDDNESPLALANVEPWPAVVDGAALLSEIVQLLGRFVKLPRLGAEAIALWILFSHAIDASDISPIIGITSPEKRCGKTRLLSLLLRMVPRPLPASNITPAAIYRAVEQYHPTLLIDEADTFLSSRDDGGEMRGILNSGHTRATAFVIRSVPKGESYETRPFSTWCPRAIACIGELPETLKDRSIGVSMRRRAPGETLERLRHDRVDELGMIARHAARWALDHLDGLRDREPEIPPELHDRAADNWRPLLAIAEEVEGDWPATARAAARALSGESVGEAASVRELLLADIRSAFEKQGDRLPTSAILENLNSREDRPWIEWGRQKKPMTARGLVRELAPFRIQPRTIRDGGQVFKGYLKADFEDTWKRYLPLISVTSVTSNADNPLQENGSVTPFRDVTDAAIDNTLTLLTVTDVTAGDGDLVRGDAWEPPEEDPPR